MVEDESLALLQGSSEDFCLWLDDIVGMSLSEQSVPLSSLGMFMDGRVL